ncbi:hypothetical protein I6F36_24215 [Bradyrhizobium sp. BRP19]|uniref:hypothetical protein n=1 Tax=Bradyrhizobium TaxID=374 RepID=UPI001CD353A9|nr:MULTISPECIES: hypothetical protein [Bradyrhizobium]MCA1549940.1 hypothetical protein [Bradyrhizobium sp. BRP19]MDF0492184.1 hypothetical protein [Bradyrhizobium yuanmingense]MDF0518647.1 hypothetical protein [Bradyrhizobium yuanmingense]MDF0579785.1 hypothetical protein [Bradyrhizobium yuanmingense]
MIYVVDVNQMSFAFVAGSESHASEIVRSPAFVQALGRFFLNRQGSGFSNHRPRAATVQELALFNDMSSEFADATADVLVARVA